MGKSDQIKNKCDILMHFNQDKKNIQPVISFACDSVLFMV